MEGQEELQARQIMRLSRPRRGHPQALAMLLRARGDLVLRQWLREGSLGVQEKPPGWLWEAEEQAEEKNFLTD